MSACFGTMQQDIGDTVLRNSQGVVGSVAGSVYFGEGSWSSEGKTLSACRAALYSADPEIDRNNIIHAKGGRTLGTCEWIKNHTRFQSWLNGDKRLLWIRGGPGKGKTVMSVYLTEEIASEQPRSFAYFFCTGQDAERNSASAVLRGLLWQIIKDKPNLQQYLLPYFDPPERGRATRSSEETLWNLFRDTCRHADIQRVYCLVDGVDECDEDSMHWLVDKFIGVEHHDDYRKLSLLVLSRPVVGLSDSTCITLDPDHHGQVSADVEIFVRSKARELSRKLRVDENFEENATRVLLEKSEGTFLWVGFVMSELLKKKTRSQVEKAMYSLPRGLPAVYARMLQNIEPDDQENGKKLLACIAVAFKPLSLKTLADILGCRSSATISEEQATLDAIAVCAPMLHIRHKRVDLVHQSAKDYLLRGSTDVGPVLEGFQIQPEAAHLYLARRCIQSLAEGSWLQHYSLMNWPNHAKHLGTVASGLLEQQPRFFGEVSVPRDLWWRKYSLQFLGLPKVVPPRLHVACFLGNSTWVGAILFEIQHSGKSVAELVDEKCPGEWLALNYAAQSASEAIMKLLLDVASNAEHSREMLGHSLIQAVLAQREEAVRLMLTHGADANASDFDGMTALLHATILQNEVIVQILLKHGADPTINDSKGLHPLEVACQLPDGQALVELLLHDLEANALYSTIRSLGDLARFPTPAGLVWLFLEAIINVNAKERNGRCRLIGSTHMAEYEFVRVVKDLLTVAANVDIHDLFGESAFHIAVRSLGGLYRSPGSMQLMRLFLETGVNVNSKGNDGRTALHTATKQADLEAVTVLCAHGANAAERDSFGETALHYTPELTVGSLEHFELMTLLARAGADVNAKNLHGQTVLHKAAEHVFMGTKSVTILLKLGADVNLSDSRGRTALHICAAQSLDIPLVTRGDYMWTIEALQDAGANPNAQDCEEKTPLHHAANGGIFRHVAALVDCGADLHIQDVDGATALHIAIVRGHSELVPLLRCKCCCANNLSFILN